MKKLFINKSVKNKVSINNKINQELFINIGKKTILVVDKLLKVLQASLKSDTVGSFDLVKNATIALRNELKSITVLDSVNKTHTIIRNEVENNNMSNMQNEAHNVLRNEVENTATSSVDIVGKELVRVSVVNKAIANCKVFVSLAYKNHFNINKVSKMSQDAKLIIQSKSASNTTSTMNTTVTTGISDKIKITAWGSMITSILNRVSKYDKLKLSMLSSRNIKGMDSVTPTLLCKETSNSNSRIDAIANGEIIINQNPTRKE